jgi:hypothetical protein
MGLGWSVEHPTVSEQAIRSAAKTSVLVVGLRFFCSVKFALAKFVLPFGKVHGMGHSTDC